MEKFTLPPLNALRAFEAAARRLSFTKASEDLDVTPGAISQQVKILEDWVGQPLFRRLGRAVELTDAARIALPLLIEGFEKVDEAARQLRLPLRRERVSVSAAPSFAAKWLVPRLESFQNQYPDIQIWVSADINLVDFTAADVDVAIRYGPGFYEGVISEKLMSEEVFPVCSPSLLSKGQEIKSPKDILSFMLLHDASPDADASCPDWTMWLAARGVNGVKANQGLRFNLSSMAIDAAVAGQGIALAKRAIAAADLANGRLIAPFGTGSDRAQTDRLSSSYWLVRPKGRTLTNSVKAFLDWIRQQAGNEDWVI